VVYDRTHSREISDYGGLHKRMPRFVALFFLFSVAAFGLPGTCNFIGEFLVLVGTSYVSFAMVLISMGGILLAASYMLWMLQRVALGESSTEFAKVLPDLSNRELATLIPLALLVLGIGLYPGPLMEMMDVSVIQLIQQTTGLQGAEVPQLQLRP
ncbi:MAG: proton-conducting transporter membrane subunit, partial [Nitrospinae bacterium]|nr:proton-conducting transporter membrane subunit [Nitrospinota bacterium]